jgi:2-methylcitrate dehydratase PrpD
LTARGLTEAAAAFAIRLQFGDIPAEAVRIAKRCVLDGLAVQVGGSEQAAIKVLDRYIRATGGAAQSRVVGNAGLRVPAHLAALWNGLAGHAMDWDDTQLSEAPGRAYGLMCHPTVPPLSAALAVADMLGGIDGPTFLTAFIAGFEIECKIAEAINPDHYMRGFHTSGTIGTFGAAVAAGRLLKFDENQMRQAIGVAASMAAGIRANFGTMTKPLHVGRSSENGVTAALLVHHGFTANSDALDGQWGYLTIAGPGGSPELVVERFGKPFSITTPGVSIKPYPSGVLTHPAMDALRTLLSDEGLSHRDVAEVHIFAGSNVLKPIRFDFATNELEAKFCFNFLLAAILVAGRAGKQEFTDAFVTAPSVQDAQRRVHVHFDPAIEAMGFDKIRSRIEIVAHDGRRLTRWADERYRGGPDNPLIDAELEEKFRDASAGLLSDARCGQVAEFVSSLESQPDATAVLALLDWGAPNSTHESALVARVGSY